jgi:hypothetical protein
MDRLGDEQDIAPEARGNEALSKFFTVLGQGARKLDTASDHYLHTYTDYHFGKQPPEGVPGVRSVIEGEISETIEYYERYHHDDDEVKKQIVKSAKKLAEKVEEPLVTIDHKSSTDKSYSQEVDGLSDEAVYHLRRVLGSDSLEAFNGASHELTDLLSDGVTNLRDAAKSAKQAAEEIKKIADEEKEEFADWAQKNQSGEFRTSVPRFKESLARFRDIAQSKSVDFGYEANSVLSTVRPEITSPVFSFISELRSERFSKSDNQ